MGYTQQRDLVERLIKDKADLTELRELFIKADEANAAVHAAEGLKDSLLRDIEAVKKIKAKADADMEAHRQQAEADLLHLRKTVGVEQKEVQDKIDGLKKTEQAALQRIAVLKEGEERLQLQVDALEQRHRELEDGIRRRKEEEIARLRG